MPKLLLLLLLGAFMTPTQAHQIKSAISTVLFNQHSNNLEVMHRFYLHDAEHAVNVIADKNADIYNSSITQQRFADYVMARFQLLIDGIAVPLNPVGYEIDGKFLWIYQDTPLPEKVNRISVKHSALQDIWSEQVNTVNIEGQINGNKALETLTFRRSGKVLEVQF